MANHSGQCRCSASSWSSVDATAANVPIGRGERHDPTGQRAVEAVVVVVAERGRRDAQRRGDPQRQPVRHRRRRPSAAVSRSTWWTVGMVDQKLRHSFSPSTSMVSAWARPPSSSSTVTHSGRPSVSGTSTVIASGRSSGPARARGRSGSTGPRPASSPCTTPAAARRRYSPSGIDSPGRIELAPQHEAVPPGASPRRRGPRPRPGCRRRSTCGAGR